MKNIIIVSQVFYPNTQSTSQLLTDLALYFQHSSYQVTAICGFPGVDRAVRDHESFSGIDIYYCGIDVDLKQGFLQRLLSYVSYLLHAFWKLLFFPNKDVILGVSNPPFLSIILMIVSYLTSCKYNFLMHDVYPEGLVVMGKLSESSFITKIWRKINQLTYQRADNLIVLGRDMKNLLVKNYQLPIDKITYIPNWSVLLSTAWVPFAENILAQELKLSDKFVVQYSGNMGLWHDIDTFVLAASKLQDNDFIQFLFIGNGIRKEQAQKLANKLKLTNILWIDFLPREQLSSSLTCAHVALISLTSGLEGIAVPCKLYGILASGRAIIAQVPIESEVAYTVIEESCGFVVLPQDSDTLADKIKQLAEDPELTAAMGQRAFQAYQAKYTIGTIAEQFKSIF